MYNACDANHFTQQLNIILAIYNQKKDIFLPCPI